MFLKLYIVIMKKLTTLLVLTAALFLGPAAAYADSVSPSPTSTPTPTPTQVQTCVQQYGGGVVCGVSTPEEKVHKTVDAGLADINPGVLGGFLLSLSAGLHHFSKKNRKRVITAENL